MRGYFAAVLAFSAAVACEDQRAARAPVTPNDEAAAAGEVAVSLTPRVVPPCFEATELADAAAPTTIPGGERGVAAIRPSIKRCYDDALLHSPDMDGKATFDMHVAQNGRVEHVEVSSTCGLAADVVLCVRDAMGRAEFEAGQAMTARIPVAFVSQATPSTATSTVGFVTVSDFVVRANEEMNKAKRPLAECAKKAAARGKFPPTWAELTVTLEPDGKVHEIQVDPYAGDQALLGCAAEAVEKVAFPPPPKGARTFHQRISFEPIP